MSVSCLLCACWDSGRLQAGMEATPQPRPKTRFFSSGPEWKERVFWWSGWFFWENGLALQSGSVWLPLSFANIQTSN